MRICIPVEKRAGRESTVCAHFGSAPYFLIYDTEIDATEIVCNGDREHTPGKCHPLRALGGLVIQAVVCRGMGLRAVRELGNLGIRALMIEGETVGEALENYAAGRSREITPDLACQDHTCHSG